MLNCPSILIFFFSNRTPVFGTVLPKQKSPISSHPWGQELLCGRSLMGEVCLKWATFTPTCSLKLRNDGWSSSSHPVLKMVWGWKPCAVVVELSSCKRHCGALTAALDCLLGSLLFPWEKSKIPFCWKCYYFRVFFDVQLNLLLKNTVALDLYLV